MIRLSRRRFLRMVGLMTGAAGSLLVACQQATAPPPPTIAPKAAPPAQPTAAPAVQATAAPGTPVRVAPAGRLTIGTTSEIESTHPYLAHQIVGISARMNMFDMLVERDYDGKLVPGLAESWKVEGLTIEFKLRRGIKFHNGEDFNADSVKFSFEHLKSEELKSPTASNVAAVAEVKVVDPYTAQVVLSKIDARIFDVLANNVSMLPPRYYQEVGLQGFIAKPVGTGPFKFVEWVKDDRLVMEANPSYWESSYKGRPLVQTLVFRPIPTAATRVAELRSGAVDLIMDVPPDQVQPLKQAGFNVVESKTPAHQYIFFNTRSEAGAPLKDIRVRQALNYAVDVQTLIETVLQGYGRRLVGGLSDIVLGYNPEVKPFPYDPARAKQLLAEAGYPGGLEFVLDLTDAVKPDLAQAVAAQLGQVGVRVKLNVMPSAIYNDRWVKRQLSPLYFNTWNTFTDPALLDLLAGCKGFLSNFCSEEAQPFLDQGGSTLDQDKRDAAYKKAVEVFARDPFAIYLNANNTLTGMNKKVQGWRAHSATYLIGTRASVQSS